MFQFQSKNLKQKKGVVLMITLSTLVFLVVIIQQMTFDSSLEFNNEVSHYHGTRAYYAAKAGVELSLLKLALYQESLSLAENFNNPLVDQALQQAHLLWKPVLQWPPSTSEVSELRESEINEMLKDSFLKDVSYQVYIQSEESKFNINDLASPNLLIRTWATDFLDNLLNNLRNQNLWLSEEYSEADLQELVDQISLHLNPTSTLTQSSIPPLNRRFINLNELLIVENFKPELLEFLRPYITVYSSGGLHLQFAAPILIQSLNRNLTPEQTLRFLELLDIENNPEAVFLNSLETLDNLFQQTGLSVLTADYWAEINNSPSLAEQVFRFDAPRNFQITATGISGKISKSISVVVHDPYYSIERAYKLMDSVRQKSDHKIEVNPSLSRLNYFNPSTPFIIEWKDVN